MKYGHDEVQVTAIDLATNEEKVFKGDAVVCTVSMGVLKNKVLKFEPELPPWKQEAI